MRSVPVFGRRGNTVPGSPPPEAREAGHPDPSDPPACPTCGGERLTYREPGVPEILVCIDCDRWSPTDEFDHFGA